MAENKKIYITANELAEMLGVSVGHAWHPAGWIYLGFRRSELQYTAS